MRLFQAIGPLLLCTSIQCLACASPMRRGLQSYGDGCFVEALAQLQEAEHQVREMNEPERARYNLYRALTHLALADMAGAELWLRRAKSQYDMDRTLLSEEDEGRLRSAWQALGYDEGQWADPSVGNHASGPFRSQ